MTLGMYVKVKLQETTARHNERLGNNLMLPKLWQWTNMQPCLAMSGEGDAQVKMLLLLSLNYSRI